MLATFWLVAAAAPTASAESDFFSNGIQGFGGNLGPSTASRAVQPDVLDDLRPGNVPYRSSEMLDAIDAARAKYQQLASAGGWPLVPGVKMIRPDDDDERVPILKKRLRAEGYSVKTGGFEGLSNSYDGDVVEAVKAFQSAHGLRPSGRVDRPTLEELNVSAEARVRQLTLNANRLQDLQRTPPEERYILVNVPAFQLEAVERYEVQQRHRVIVGRNERETPNVKAMIRAVNFFPYWRVPDSIGTLDLVPRLRREPDYLEKEGIRVYSAQTMQEMDPRSIDWKQVDPAKIKFKQDPGERNALGLVRIDMSNEFGVYMHDTPMKKLFDSRQRNLSAGCVRVQEVFRLVEWITRYEPGFEQPGRVEMAKEQGLALDVTLTRTLPVYFAYITAWGEPDGSVHFRPDIYNRDGLSQVGHGGDAAEANEPPPPPQSLQSLAP